MTTPPHGGPPPGDPGRPQQPWPQQPWPQQPWPQQAGPQQPWAQQPGPWGPPAPGPPGGQPPYGQPPYGPPSPQYGQPWGGQPAPGQPPYWVGQPQYGQPQYGGPPYGRQPRRSHTRTFLGLAALAALLVLAVVLARLLGDTVLDREAVERDVAVQFEELEGVAVDVSCPEEMTVEADAVYRCTGTTADGEDLTLEVRITDVVTASYTWEEV